MYNTLLNKLIDLGIRFRIEKSQGGVSTSSLQEIMALTKQLGSEEALNLPSVEYMALIGALDECIDELKARH